MTKTVRPLVFKQIHEALFAYQNPYIKRLVSRKTPFLNRLVKTHLLWSTGKHEIVVVYFSVGIWP